MGADIATTSQMKTEVFPTNETFANLGSHSSVYQVSLKVVDIHYSYLMEKRELAPFLVQPARPSPYYDQQ